MAESNYVLDLTFKAGANLATKQYYLLKADTTADQVVLAGANDKVLGVLQDKPNAAGKSASVTVIGTTKVVLGNTVAYGDSLISDANGKAIAVGATVNGNVIGYALAAGVAGDIIRMLVARFVKP